MASQFEDEFVPGAIREIKLSRFLIYDKVNVKPGPHLNVIIGPNATGKSTIVNAICLGLAGKVTILGRAKDLSAYIKNGYNEAIIEIELQSDKSRNHIIKRIIKRGGTTNSSWFINGRPSQQKHVEELVYSLNIQVSNLCQFLPQDRVADFVKMTNTELLTNTMLSADRELYEKHCKLKEAQKRSQEFDSDFSKLTEQLEREKKINASLERDVVNIEERQEHERKLANLKEKRPWVEYEEYRRLHIRQKEEKDEVEGRYNAAMALSAPAKKALELLKRKQTEKISDYRDVGQKILAATREVSAINESVQTFTERMDEVESALRAKENMEKARLKRVDAINSQIQSMEAQLANIKERNLKPEIEKVVKDIKRMSAEKAELDDEIATVASEKESKRHEIIALESDLKRVKDVDIQKLNVIRRRDKDTYDAIMWLRAHRNEFEDVIYEPPLMTLNVKERGNAKFVESNIGFNDLKTFICVSAADQRKFYRRVRVENRLIINVAVALRNGPDHYQPPADIKQYRRFGFHSYLKDMVEAPDPVLAYVCHLSGLHRIPVGDSRVNNCLDEIPKECRGITRYVSNTHTHSYKISQFGARNVLTRSVDLRPASLLIHSVDESRLEELNSTLRILKQEETELTGRIQTLNLRLAAVTKQIEEAKQLKIELIKKQSERKTVEEKLRMKKASLAQLEEQAVDIEAARLESEGLCQQIHADRLKVFSKQADKTEVVVSRCKQRCVLGLESYSMSLQIKKKEAELAEKSLQVIDLERELSEKKERLAATKDTAKRLQAIARKTVGDPSDLSAEQQRIFKQLPGDLEELDAMIADVQARIDLIFVDSDRSVLDEFNNRKKTIEKLENKLTGRQASQTAHRDEISQIKDSWLPPLQEIVDKINLQFSHYFKQIKCAGEISLRIPADPDDFDNYGVNIKVKYGDNKPMKELTTFQSGGERSVATVLYMLSLQELSSSPFRCVDEINQGMDAENERRVFELVVQTACKPSTPQYFLLTPKLLPDLLYTDRMAIHIVHNGPYMLDHEHWNVDNFILKRGEFAD